MKHSEKFIYLRSAKNVKGIQTFDVRNDYYL